MYKDLGNGLFQRNRLRRRPGTVAVAAAIQNKYNITVVPHILCSGFTREETEYVLLDLQFLNITELLVLRGDKAKHESVFTTYKNTVYSYRSPERITSDEISGRHIEPDDNPIIVKMELK